MFFKKIKDRIPSLNTVKSWGRSLIKKKKKKKRKKYIPDMNMTKNIVLFVIAVGVFFSGVIIIWISTLEIPTLDSFDERRVAQSTKIYDRTGETLLYDVYKNVQRTIVPFSDIATSTKQATLAIEDPDFYQHSGIKPSAILRAVFVNIATMDYTQGGSTITQQVVKNSLLTPEKTITRKIKEWLLALKLEGIKTKTEILTIYLNEVPFGGSIYGVEEASQIYFGKTAKDLTIAESAYLASLPKAPTRYLNNPEALENRKNTVLLKMREFDYITPEEYREAKAETHTLSPQDDTTIRAPHFVMYVLELLEDEYGERMVRQGGLRVVTTLDYELQKKAQEIVTRNARENATNFNANNAAMTALDPNTGDILVMVGSRNYFSEEIDGQFNVVTAHRQPGSTFKPFAYAAALQKGYTPETVVFDLKTQFSTACNPYDLSNESPCYSPQNYDERFRGPVSFREALAQSINIPAIKVLYLAGMEETLQLAQQMGVSHLGNIRQYGLTLVLGGGEVSLLDMTKAYGVFAANGIKHEQSALLKVENSDGKVLFEKEQNSIGTRVLSENTALQISDILSDNAARAPAFGQRSLLYFPTTDVAVKTGTTNNYKDAWIIGYTPDIVVGTWAGNNDNSSMVKRVAGFIVAPMWNEFMNEVITSSPQRNFTQPIVKNRDDLKPILNGNWRIENGSSTTVHSILHWVDRNNPQGPTPRTPQQDVQYRFWEYPVQIWWASQATSSDSEVVNDESEDEESDEENEEDEEDED